MENDPFSQFLPWWTRSDLSYEGGRLHLAGVDVGARVDAVGTPCFLYAAERVRANADRLRGALAGAGLEARLLYALKANRFPPLVSFLRESGCVDGLDVCSPGEVRRALACGFPPERLYYTATSMAEADLDFLARLPEITVTVDSLSALRRLGARCPGRRIGLRLNPGIGLGYRKNEQLRYAGTRPTKFGIYPDQLEDAIALADAADLHIDLLHVHAGCAYLNDQLEAFDAVLAQLAEGWDRLPGVRRVDVGGGLGVPYQAGDVPLDLDAWATRIARHLGGRGGIVLTEPGDYLVRDAGLLVLRVNTVETKAGVHFAGVDGGFQLTMYPAFYDMPLAVAPCQPRSGPLRPVTLAGNINEALDELAVDTPLPPLAEGDLVALLNCGGYSASMSSQHCLRGDYEEHLLFGGPA